MTDEEVVKAKWPDAYTFYNHFGLCEILVDSIVIGEYWGGAGCMPKAWADAARRIRESERKDG